MDSLLDEPLGRNVQKREVHIAIRRDGGLGADGTPDNPLDGSTSNKLDLILNALKGSPFAQRNTRFIFGPGIFRTQGGLRSGDINFGWKPQAGQEFIGSGMYATILRLELPSTLTNRAYTLISSDLNVDGLVVSDMTLDYGIDGFPPSPPYNYPRVAVRGIEARGSHVRISRVRVINAGTRTPDFDYQFVPPVGAANGEDGTIFDINTSLRDESDSVIEDCVIEEPYQNSARETPAFTLQGPYDNICCGFRNCVSDCAYSNPDPFGKLPVQLLVFTGTEGILTTLAQHDLKPGQEVEITGSENSSHNGLFVVTSVTDQWTVRFAASAIPAVDSGPALRAEKIGRPALMVDTISWSAGVVTITTPTKHRRKTNDWVFIYGVNTTNYDACNGTFQVTVVDDYQLQYSVPGADPGILNSIAVTGVWSLISLA